MQTKTYEVVKKISGGWWVMFSGLERDQAAMVAAHYGAFAKPEETDDNCLPVVEWE